MLLPHEERQKTISSWSLVFTLAELSEWLVRRGMAQMGQSDSGSIGFWFVAGDFDGVCSCLVKEETDDDDDNGFAFTDANIMRSSEGSRASW